MAATLRHVKDLYEQACARATVPVFDRSETSSGKRKVSRRCFAEGFQHFLNNSFLTL